MLVAARADEEGARGDRATRGLHLFGDEMHRHAALMQLTEGAHRGESLPLEEVAHLPLTVDRADRRIERGGDAERGEGCRGDVAVDPHRHRQTPRGDIVEVRVARLRLRFEERAREAAARLIELHGESARGEFRHLVLLAVVVA